MARRRHYGTFMGPDGLSPLVGAAAGAGVGTITAIAVRRFSSMDSWSELVGMGGGVLTGLVMMFPEGSRQAGIAGVVTAILNNGVRFAASKIFEKEKIRDACGELASLKEKKENLALKTQYDALAAQITAVKGNMGLVRPEQVPTLAGGLGAVSAHPMQLAAVSTHDPGALGTLSVRDMPLADGGETGAGPPVQLVGLGKHYGATIYGSR